MSVFVAVCVQMPWEEGEEKEAADKVTRTSRLSAKRMGAVKQALAQRQKQLTSVTSGSNKLAAQLFDWESKEHGSKH